VQLVFSQKVIAYAVRFTSERIPVSVDRQYPRGARPLSVPYGLLAVYPGWSQPQYSPLGQSTPGAAAFAGAAIGSSAPAESTVSAAAYRIRFVSIRIL
jgi:hypothetical protein